MNVLKKRVLWKSLSFEELNSTLTEVEAVVNSRPIFYVYDNPVEPEPVTPAHFLVGKMLTSLPTDVMIRSGDEA